MQNDFYSYCLIVQYSCLKIGSDFQFQNEYQFSNIEFGSCTINCFYFFTHLHFDMRPFVRGFDGFSRSKSCLNNTKKSIFLFENIKGVQFWITTVLLGKN